MGFLDSAKKFFGGAGNSVAAALDELGQFTERLQQIFDKWDGIKGEFDDLFDAQPVEKVWRGRVVTVFDAETVIEDLRINALKDRALKIYQDIKDIFNLVLHPIGGSAEGDAAIRAGAAAFAGKPGAGGGAFTAASLINAVLNFEDRVLELEDKILELVQLLDVIQDMRDKIEAAALQQRNPQIRIDDPYRKSIRIRHG